MALYKLQNCSSVGAFFVRPKKSGKKKVPSFVKPKGGIFFRLFVLQTRHKTVLPPVKKKISHQNALL
jgi:hypothetical protein